MASSLRIAILIDDEPQRERYAAYLSSRAQVYDVSGGGELVNLIRARVVNVVVAGVLNQNDEFLPSALHEIGRIAPQISLIGIFEPSRPSLDEAADLARAIPAMGFVHRPGSRLEYLAAPRRPGDPAVTFTPVLLDCIDRLPLFGAARAFALLQALHPSFIRGIPDQARELGVSRRNLERWFQGPDICSAGSFQSICAAAEAAYLRLMVGMPEREIASVVGILTREGVVNPIAVPRVIRNALRLGLDELRAGGMAVLRDAVEALLRTSRDPTKAPAQWEPDTRYAPQRGVLTVPIEDRLVLIDPVRGVEYPLDVFGMDAWHFVAHGAPFAKMTLGLASARREPPHAVRARLIAWLGKLLVLGLVRRDRGSAEVEEA